MVNRPGGGDRSAAGAGAGERLAVFRGPVAAAASLGLLVLVARGGTPIAGGGRIVGGLVRMAFVLGGQALTVAGWLAAAAGWGWAVSAALGGGGAGADRSAGDLGASSSAGAGEAEPLGLMGQTVLGGGLMGLAMWLGGWAGWATPAWAWSVGGIGWGLMLMRVWRKRAAWAALGAAPPGLRWSMIPAIAAGVLLAACCTLAPSGLWAVEHYAYDALSYHLQLPAEWMRSGAIAGLGHNVYSYMPNLFEAEFMQVGLWRGGMIEGAYAAQLIHATMAVLTAGLAARIVSRAAPPPAPAPRPAAGAAGALAAGVYLAAPWTLVTGSLAYNEQAVNALGAVALLLALTEENTLAPALPGESEGRESRTASRADGPRAWRIAGAWRRGAMVGLACGLAVLCKLTAAGMIAAPVGLILLVVGRGGWSGRLARCGGFAVAAGGLLTLWMARNLSWTGNPVFPMFTEWLGTGPWSVEQAARWRAAHRPDASAWEVLAALWREGPGHAMFAYVLFPAALLGAVAAVWGRRAKGAGAPSEHAARTPPARGGGGRPSASPAGGTSVARTAWLMLAMIAVQTLFWAALTHHQSRFLVPLLLPMAILVGLGIRAAPRPAVAAAAAVAVIALCLSLNALRYAHQKRGAAPIFIDAIPMLASRPPGTSAATVAALLNALPPDARVYAEGYATPFYVRRPIAYHTVWDESPLGDALRTGGPRAAHRWLRRRGYTHVVIDWAMLRLWTRAGNYGYDPDVSLDALRTLTRRFLDPVRRWPSGRVVYKVR